MVAIIAHKFGGPSGVGVLLMRDLTLSHRSGGQEQGYRAGTENVPAVMSMAVALEARLYWLGRAAELRQFLYHVLEEAGVRVLARERPPLPAIARERLPGVAASGQLIPFDTE